MLLKLQFKLTGIVSNGLANPGLPAVTTKKGKTYKEKKTESRMEKKEKLYAWFFTRS
jgi:hypothetical protein